MFNLKITSEKETTTSPVEKSAVQISEFQQKLKRGNRSRLCPF